jgi:hypothetical protein
MSPDDVKRATIEFIMIDMLALPHMKQREDDAVYFARLGDKEKACFYLLMEFESFSQDPASYLGHEPQYSNHDLAAELSSLSRTNAENEGNDVYGQAMARLAAFKVMDEFFDKAKERLHLQALDSPFSARRHAIQIDILQLELASNKAVYCNIQDFYDGEPALPAFKQEFVARSLQRQNLPKLRF